MSKKKMMGYLTLNILLTTIMIGVMAFAYMNADIMPVWILIGGICNIWMWVSNIIDNIDDIDKYWK